MNITDNTITLRASDIDFELEGEETIPCEYVNYGKLPTLLTGLKASGIASLFKHLDTQKVVIHFTDGNRAFIIEPVPQPDYEDVLMLQMPMMLSD
jgi:DNA polymerase-3 subunit beta